MGYLGQCTRTHDTRHTAVFPCAIPVFISLRYTAPLRHGATLHSAIITHNPAPEEGACLLISVMVMVMVAGHYHYHYSNCDMGVLMPLLAVARVVCGRHH